MFRPLPKFRFIAAVAATVLVGCSNNDEPRKVPGNPSSIEKPNVILIVIDTARADHFSAYGYDHQTTPNIDALALDAVRFADAHSVAPWTLPAHMSIFTGLLPGEHGATWRAYSQPADMSLQTMMTRRFEPNNPQRMLTSLLKKAGYRTWGYSSNPWVVSRTGFATGFDTFSEIWRPATNYAEFYAKLPNGLKIEREYDFTPTGKSLVLFKRQVIAGRPETPFFAFFNFMDPHYAYAPPGPFAEKFNGDRELLERISRFPTDMTEMALLAGYQPIDLTRLIPLYDAELNYADFMIGNLIDWLRDRQLYKDTLLIITSDHGEHLGEDGRFSHQLSIAEELLRIPLIIKFPAGKNAGTVSNNPLVSNLDIYQTILSAIGQPKTSSEYPSSSLDLADMDSFDRDQLIAEYYFSDAYLRQIKDQHEPFDMALHRYVRRAVFTANQKIEFENLENVAVTSNEGQSIAAIGATDIENIKSGLRAYVRRIGETKLETMEPSSADPELIERLKSLGYLDGGTRPVD